MLSYLNGEGSLATTCILCDEEIIISDSAIVYTRVCDKCKTAWKALRDNVIVNSTVDMPRVSEVDVEKMEDAFKKLMKRGIQTC